MMKAEYTNTHKNLLYIRWLAAFCFCLHLFFSFVGWKHSVLDRYGFRQSQTAITSYYFIQDGFKLKYETPVLGAPWSIPFEFPLYQGIVAFVSKILKFDLDQTGRAVNLAFFYASCVMVYLLINRLAKSKVCGYLAVSLLLASPIYIFWSRTFMIESTALFFCLVYIFCVVLALEKRKIEWGILAVVTGIIGAIVKVTTFTLAFPIAAMLCLSWWLFKDNQLFSRRLFGKLTVMLLCYIAIPLMIAIVWTKFTDMVKSQNPLADFILSKNLGKWILGTWEQKLSINCWNGLFGKFSRVILGIDPTAISGYFPILIIAFLSLLYFSGKQRLYFTILFGLFMLGPVLYTNLYFVHEYYWYANALYLLIAIAFVLNNMLEHPISAPITRWIFIPSLICLMLCGYYRQLLPNQIQDAAKPFVASAKLITQHVDNNGIILCYGLDWDPSLSYYARRRAIMIRKDKSLEEATAIQQIGESNIQALALGYTMKSNNDIIQSSIARFHLSPTPIVARDEITIFIRNDKVNQSTKLPVAARN